MVNKELIIQRHRELMDKVEDEKQLKEKENMILGELRCSWCERMIIDGQDTHFYFCVLHKNIFCDSCAHNFYKAEIDLKDAPKCKNKFLSKQIGYDCIYEKKFLKLKEIEEDNHLTDKGVIKAE